MTDQDQLGPIVMKSGLCGHSFPVRLYQRNTPSRCPKCRGKAWSRRPTANAYAYGSGWAARARQVLKRDQYRCQLRFACGGQGEPRATETGQ
jgi:hypothetical protein